DAVGEGAVVGVADHGGLAVVPVGDDLGASRIPSDDAALQPVDHDAHARDVAGAAVHGAPGGGPSAVHVGEDDGVAARHEVVVEVLGPHVVDAVAVAVGDEL